jgi:D-serine deaminase-like pyridoxal phosphate-dependent protein
MFSIKSPTLLVDEAICKNNIRRMKRKADRIGLQLKPHVKTHQSADIGEWLKEAGVRAITVSSVTMASYFAAHGWSDITIAFPVNPLEADSVNYLASAVNLSILAADLTALTQLESTLDNEVAVYIEIDTGSGRTGFPSTDLGAIREAALFIRKSDKLKLRGFYSHPGHSYACRSRQEVERIHEDARVQLAALKEELQPDFGPLMVCMGDTPCCSVAERFDGVDEISPGNFVFYDLMQTQIGSCTPADIAVALAVPVVACYPERAEVVVHGGAVHLSKDTCQLLDSTVYGVPVSLNGEGWSAPLQDCYLKAVSQEHGILACTKSVAASLKPGDILGILPVHSCLTADLMMGFTTLNGTKLNHIRTSALYSHV